MKFKTKHTNHRSTWSSKFSKMARKGVTTKTTLFPLLISLIAFGAFVPPVFAPLPSLSNHSSSHKHKRVKGESFEIANDMFWKNGEPFQIIGGDLHYFRVLPEYWEDRLLRAKALGLNTIQTYVPWNLHEPQPGELVFEGIANLMSYLKLCQKLDLLVMLRAGPYICAEWELGGFPAWLLSIKPALQLRSSDPVYLRLVEKWWGVLLPKISPFLYNNGGPIIMVQIENEFGSYGDDKAYLHFLVKVARKHLGDEIILYTTDGGSRPLLEKGTIRGDAVYSAVDFGTRENPWPIFQLQKEFNSPGKSPPLSSEFYTGWLTHWGEKIASTDAACTASELENILSNNGSAVLYMALGGTNFGFYSGANAGDNSESDYKADITSYDYDAPIKESGDVDNAKFKALRSVIQRHTASSLPSVPLNIEKTGYGAIQLQKSAFLFDLLDFVDPADVVESENPLSMETVGQMFGFIVYVSKYASKDEGSTLSIPKVHDRAQVFASCSSVGNSDRPEFVGVIERWSNQNLTLPKSKCTSNVTIYILVENMGRVNYGAHIHDQKGILSPVFLDGRILHEWKMISLPFQDLNELRKINPIVSGAHSGNSKFVGNSESISKEPASYAGRFIIENLDQVKDTFISFTGWGKGVAFVNDFNIGRYWPLFGPQCNLYVPAPILRQGENVLAILELESPDPELVVHSVDRPDFTCASSKSSIHQL